VLAKIWLPLPPQLFTRPDQSFFESNEQCEESVMVFVRTNGNDSHSDRVVASAQDEIRRLSRDGGALQSQEATSLSSGLTIVGKIIGRGALTIFGHVEGELRASTVVIAEGAEMVGDVVAEELTVNGHVKGGINANRVRLGSAGVVEGDISHQTLAMEESARFEGASRRNEKAIDAQLFVHKKRPGD
jgi:cytoskeletal protein CcmA (bactofilin family)